MWYTRQSGLYRICFTIPFVDNAYFAKIDISTKLTFFFAYSRDQKINGKKKKDEKKNDSFTSTTNTSIKKRKIKKREGEKKKQRKMEGKERTRIA